MRIESRRYDEVSALREQYTADVHAAKEEAKEELHKVKGRTAEDEKDLVTKYESALAEAKSTVGDGGTKKTKTSQSVKP